jgi:hypothetical protein
VGLTLQYYGKKRCNALKVREITRGTRSKATRHKAKRQPGRPGKKARGNEEGKN